MGWQGQLHIHYRRDGDRSVTHDRHSGPLRVLQSLYPEGWRVCHHVLVHPPGGIVGGDVLDIDLQLDADAHALITTPGATRFYRTAGERAAQRLVAKLAPGARLEWLPLETIAYSGCIAENVLCFELAPGAEMMGWDVLALGLPAAGQGFDDGSFLSSVSLPNVWLERGHIHASDRRLLHGPLGFAGHCVLATMWFAAGSPLAPARRDALLDAAREAVLGHALKTSAGVTSPHDEVVVLRVLAPRVEPAMQLLAAVWARWRSVAWSLAAVAPRVWRT